ncbi:MAG: pyridoxamine 5'-phosphate oxidase family protein [Chitinispirillaceae bacterium]|nr:pyridoxamine 5'-phosphate oxidase family protein [Chitinispirillaceae bacterium]
MSKKLPQEVISAWNDREGPLVATTVDAAGVPNSIYASIVNITADGRIAVADNYFNKTAANISHGGQAAILFITKGRKSYQIKGRFEYRSAGPLYEEMLTWADPKHPRKGVAVMNPEEAYCGSERLL